MNYYALFLEINNYVEKCLALMRFISNPYGRSLPHITVRLFKVAGVRIEETKKHKFTHLNILEPGTFNLEEKRGAYVVFLRCESEELEGIEYKPDFPCSRLHLTIYEGDDYDYALKLFELLKTFRWHFKLQFDRPRQLTERTVGGKNKNQINFSQIFEEITESNYREFCDRKENREYRLYLVEMILHKLECHLMKEKYEEVDSLYEKFSQLRDSNDEGLGQYQMNFDPSLDNEKYVVKKPVRDAIYITPPEYAKDMAKCGLQALGDDNREINFGDSSVGTGTLFLALRSWIDEVNKEKKNLYTLKSAIGIDIDKKMADEAFVRCNKRGLSVIYGDALSPNLEIGEKRNLMLVNPPFNRHEEIPNDYKDAIYQLAKEQTGISISKKAGLYAYHLLIMDKWLCDGGVAIWLLPSIFMQSKYGMAIRKYLIENVQLIRIHVYNDELEQFEKINIATSIVVFRKNIKEKKDDIIFSYGASVEQPERFNYVNGMELVENMNNWRVLLDRKRIVDLGRNAVTFGDLFEIKRGVATGANSFFVMSKEMAIKYHIPDIALRPLLPKARHINSLIINAKEDGYPDVEPQLVLIDCDLDEVTIKMRYPDFYNYLQLAKQKGDDGKAIIERTLVRGRKPWYKQERREPPMFLMTYMGRNKKDLPPLYFLLNKSNGIALNTYLLLYPKEWLKEKIQENSKMSEIVLDILNNSAEQIVSERTRIYSGGLKKIEPKELCNLPVIGMEKIMN